MELTKKPVTTQKIKKKNAEREKNMKICITAKGKTLDNEVDPRFGRCECFIIVETDDLKFEAYENESAQAMGGAGVQAGRFVADKGVKAVLTGNVGPNAYQTLNASGIEIYTGASGKVSEVIEKFKNGEFSKTENSTVDHKSGVSG